MDIPRIATIVKRSNKMIICSGKLDFNYSSTLWTLWNLKMVQGVSRNASCRFTRDNSDSIFNAKTGVNAFLTLITFNENDEQTITLLVYLYD